MHHLIHANLVTFLTILRSHLRLKLSSKPLMEVLIDLSDNKTTHCLVLTLWVKQLQVWLHKRDEAGAVQLKFVLTTRKHALNISNYMAVV